MTIMKTAVSLPDPLFDAADALARRLALSRSELYARAIAAFLEHHRYHGVREALDNLYPEEPSGLDPVLSALQAASLREDW